MTFTGFGQLSPARRSSTHNPLFGLREEGDKEGDSNDEEAE